MVTEMDRITGLDGEGVMLRRADSRYEGKRSDKLLKVKKFEDAEAIIIGYEPGTGRLKGLMGALKVRDCTNEKEFKIGGGFKDE